MILKQATAYSRKFLMVDNVSHVNGATGKTVTVKIGKGAGATGTNPAGPVTELDATNLPGHYQVGLGTADTGVLGDLDFECTAAGCDPTTFIDQVQAQIFTDLAINASGQVLIASNYKQNQPALLPFTMTVGNPPIATPGLAPVGQKNFGSGFSPIAGPITDLGFGAYLASLQASDCNAAVGYYHFTSTTPNANEVDITLYFQP